MTNARKGRKIDLLEALQKETNIEKCDFSHIII